MALRNEDYIAFMDESGETNLQVVSGVLIPARWLRGAERRWRDFVRHQLGSQSGKTEIHAQDLLNGQGGAAYHASQTSWFWLMYAALITRPRAPRPRLPLVVIDGQDDSFREAHDLVAHRFYSNFWGRQPYIPRGNSWFIGGSLQHRSESLPFIQMADVVANAARHMIARRKPYSSWYEDHLRSHAKTLGHGRTSISLLMRWPNSSGAHPPTSAAADTLARWFRNRWIGSRY